MRLGALLCIPFVLMACTDEKPESWQSIGAQTVPLVAKPVAKSPVEQFEEFKRDIDTCKSAVVTFGKDTVFLEEFGNANKRAAKPMVEFLKQASFAKSADIQRMIAAPQYFEVDVTYHPTEFAISWVKDEAIYCGIGLQRLGEIEALGESPQAWEVRQYFLDRWLKDLRSPSDEMDFYPEQYNRFNEFIEPAAKLYSTNQRESWLAWVRKAIDHYNAQRSELIDGAGGESLAEQNKTLDREVSYLEAFLAR